MKNIHSERHVPNIDVLPNTKIGQHFVINGDVLMKMIKLLPIGSDILEIGAGKGQLTEVLSKTAKKVQKPATTAIF